MLDFETKKSWERKAHTKSGILLNQRQKKTLHHTESNVLVAEAEICAPDFYRFILQMCKHAQMKIISFGTDWERVKVCVCVCDELIRMYMCNTYTYRPSIEFMACKIGVLYVGNNKTVCARKKREESPTFKQWFIEWNNEDEGKAIAMYNL